MESKSGSVYGLCGHGGRIGGQRDRNGAEVRGAGCAVGRNVVWGCQCYCQCACYVEVCDVGLVFEGWLANVHRSSIVLWVSQNMEDDYTYNLAL